jgi:hypothetical protein
MARAALSCTFSGNSRSTCTASSSIFVMTCILSRGRDVRPCAQSNRVVRFVRHAMEAGRPRRGTRLGAEHDSAATRSGGRPVRGAQDNSQTASSAPASSLALRGMVERELVLVREADHPETNDRANAVARAHHVPTRLRHSHRRNRLPSTSETILPHIDQPERR